MAALGVVGLVVGLAIGLVMAWDQKRRGDAMAVEADTQRQRADGLEGVVRMLDGQLTVMREGATAERETRELLLGRLLDTALPQREEPVEDKPPGSPGEYDPPLEQVGDWTDPFIGLDRPLVGGLAPGQAIPGIGGQAVDPQEAADAWMEQHYDANRDALAGEEQRAALTDRGDAWFEAWDDARMTGADDG